MKKCIILVFFVIGFGLPNSMFGQVTITKGVAKQQFKFSPKEIEHDWMFEIKNLDNPKVGNEGYKKYFASQKAKVNAKYNTKSTQVYIDNRLHSLAIDTPIVDYAYEGNIYSSGVPSDNAMAVSNDGIIVSAINTNIQFYDTNKDSLLRKLTLRQFSWGLVASNIHQYDPKAIYDYINDRFILVFLAGSGTSVSSNIVVGFSTTNNPMDDWNVYILEGNPFNDESWTDYPAISLTDKELFITGNLIKTGGGSWQTSFKQSLIWQLDVKKGYDGEELDFNIFSDIKYKGVNCRNIHPVRGGNKFYGPEMYFLSERNFDIENDTFFVMKTNKYLNDEALALSVDYIIADEKYGMPPDAEQPIVGKPLATNDSRVLGAFFHDDKIQFVGNSVDVNTGHASFYHGVFDTRQLNLGVHLNVFSDSVMEYGYPNISYCGSLPESQQSIITYDYSSYKTKPGMGSFIYQGGNDKYSFPIVLKEGETNIDILTGSQRWGDYSASQPRYNKVGQVWAAGTYGKMYLSKQAYGTWIASLNTNLKDQAIVPEGESISSIVYPNPISDIRAIVEFSLEQNDQIIIQIVDIMGKVIDNVYNDEAQMGRNRISLSTEPLANGIYFVIIKNNSEILKTHKISVLNN